MRIVQIFSMVNVEDAVRVAELGADHVGFMVSDRGLEYTVSPHTGREICRRVSGLSRCVMLPISHDIYRIADWIDIVEPDILQVASYEEYLPLGRYIELYSYARSHGVKVTRAIPMGSGREMGYVERYRRYSDILLLDTHGDPPSRDLKGFIGGTGRTHDWGLSRRIVESVELPVIVAGGLHPGNVVSLLKTVDPWGVDAATRLDIPGSGGRKDLEKVKAFIYIVKNFYNR